MDGQTVGRMNKRMETCTPKSPMLKQVRQKTEEVLISDFQGLALEEQETETA